MKFHIRRNSKIIGGIAAALILCPAVIYGLKTMDLLPQFWPFDAASSPSPATASPSHESSSHQKDQIDTAKNEPGSHVEQGEGHASNDKEQQGDGHTDGPVQEAAGESDRSKFLPSVSIFQAEIKSLLIAQTASAHGRSSSVGTQREVMDRLRVALKSFDGKSSTQRDVEGLAVYLLSGGSPRGLGKLIDEMNLSGQFRHVIKGAQAYASGDLEASRRELSTVEATRLPPLVRGRVLLAQATLASEESLETQRKLLVLAASVLPGTLVEEAALRRLLALDLKRDDGPAFAAQASRYLRRYPRSLYIDDFVDTLAEGFVAFESRKTGFERQQIEQMIKLLPPPRAEEAVLSTARRAAASGLRDLCLYMGIQNLRNLVTSVSAMERLRLYTAACDVVERPAQTLQQLSGIRGDMLEQPDIELRADAIRMATSMLGHSDNAEASSPQGPELPDPQTQDILVSATQQLSATRDLIKEASQ